jgi:hypothetical protein
MSSPLAIDDVTPAQMRPSSDINHIGVAPGFTDRVVKRLGHQPIR